MSAYYLILSLTLTETIMASWLTGQSIYFLYKLKKPLCKRLLLLIEFAVVVGAITIIESVRYLLFIGYLPVMEDVMWFIIEISLLALVSELIRLAIYKHENPNLQGE